MYKNSSQINMFFNKEALIKCSICWHSESSYNVKPKLQRFDIFLWLFCLSYNRHFQPFFCFTDIHLKVTNLPMRRGKLTDRKSSNGEVSEISTLKKENKCRK